MDTIVLGLAALSVLPLVCLALYDLFPLPIALVVRRRVQWSALTAALVLGFWLLAGA